MPRIPINIIRLAQGEIPASVRFRFVNVRSWTEANHLLRRWATTLTSPSACRRCDFWIVFADSYVYAGSYNLFHLSRETPDLAASIVRHLGCTSGLLKPAGMSDPQWDSIRNFYATQAPHARQMILNYEIPGIGPDILAHA